ncbi:hypothetical protein EGW08_015870 [Elysia chlorotica]|uniref:Fibrinogen C-terminal domain-containing protein n=1 Tax=Elysia chlorotica TaxID=188477 RepID=A0A3S0ZDE4_ELYCH|nr:hypothetical protein EGW08_015870 [Elysia chlorotica]
MSPDPQRRINGTENFNRDWIDYKYGFGDINGEFWLGNENIHLLTSADPYELRIDMKLEGRDVFAGYTAFRIENERNKYRMHLGAYYGNTGEEATYGFSYHNGMAFSTKDRDNDPDSRDCAKRYQGGWWYNSCRRFCLNGNLRLSSKWYIGSRKIYPIQMEMKMRKL